MCRLFGLTAGTRRVSASFWLLDAPDSLEVQSHRNRDGTGIGYFGHDGEPVIDKQPEAAYSDIVFIRDALTVESTTFAAHVRVATTGIPKLENTHPFEIDGLILAHNGGFEELDTLDSALGDDLANVSGDTDSERFLALIAKSTESAGGDVTAGITHAARWIAEHLPLFSLNIVVVTEHELWALRYPDHHRLYACRRTAGGLNGRSASVAVTTDGLDAQANPGGSVIIASEPMDQRNDWRLMESGELLHVAPDLSVHSTLILPDPPRRRSIDPLPLVR